MDASRAAHTESLFRDVNERIADATDGAPVDEMQVFCECDDPACTAAIHLPLEEYERIRSGSRLFIVKPGHTDSAIEHVVASGHGYEVVEKDDPDAAEVADQLDPRS